MSSLDSSFFFLTIVLLADHLIFYGDYEISIAVDDGQNSMSSLSTLFQSISTTSTAMGSDSRMISSLVNSSSVNCSFAAGLGVVSSYTSELSSAASSINTQVDGVPNQLTIYTNYLIQYGRNAKAYVVYVFYCGIMLVVFAFGGGCIWENKTMVQVAIAASVIIVIPLTVICCVEMIIITFLADLCFSPTENVLSIVPGGQTKSILSYYSSCVGTNPLSSYTTNSSYYITMLNSSINALAFGPNATCPKNQYLMETTFYLNDLSLQISNLNSEIACPVAARLWATTLNQSICTHLFTGFYVMWISQFITSAGLFLTMCLGSVVYQYFGDFWRLTKNSRSLDAPEETINPIEYEMLSTPQSVKHQEYTNITFA